MAHDSPKKADVDEPQPKINIIIGRRKHGIWNDKRKSISINKNQK